MKCQAMNSSGEPCGAQALRDSAFCFMHAPERGAERAEARRRGGQRLRPAHSGEGMPAKVRTLEDVLQVLDYALAEALPLENSVQRGRLIVAIANAFIEAIKTGELENRIAAIESALKAREVDK